MMMKPDDCPHRDAHLGACWTDAGERRCGDACNCACHKPTHVYQLGWEEFVIARSPEEAWELYRADAGDELSPDDFGGDTFEPLDDADPFTVTLEDEPEEAGWETITTKSGVKFWKKTQPCAAWCAEHGRGYFGSMNY